MPSRDLLFSDGNFFECLFFFKQLFGNKDGMSNVGSGWDQRLVSKWVKKPQYISHLKLGEITHLQTINLLTSNRTSKHGVFGNVQEIN